MNIHDAVSCLRDFRTQLAGKKLQFLDLGVWLQRQQQVEKALEEVRMLTKTLLKIGRGRKTILGGADFRFSAGAMFFGGRAELFEKSRKSENFFLIDLSNSRDFFNSESLAQHF